MILRFSNIDSSIGIKDFLFNLLFLRKAHLLHFSVFYYCAIIKVGRINMKKIDTSYSVFEDLILSNNLYVDKTSYLYRLITQGNRYYFLSRPRRFGKSLTLSTLDAIFKGKRELFKGLYIDSTDYDWKEHPVVHIDFSKCQEDNKEEIKEWINDILFQIAKEYKIKLNKKKSYSFNLDLLITELAKKEKVVVLIDEYDSLLNSNINNENIEDIRSVLRGFYSVIKASSTNIRFCFITGVTKFSKMSIFSSMNNLVDISMDDEYSTMLGYTQKELEENFSEYIDKAVKEENIKREEYLEKVKRWYDGYKFSANGESVYNPVSIGLFFTKGGRFFRNYWISTGGMSYLLTEVAKRVKFDVTLGSGLKISEDKLHSTDIVQMLRTNVSRENFLALLYQSGYLTIKEATLVSGSYLLTLGYPNEEVENGLNEILLPAYIGSSANSFDRLVIISYFNSGNVSDAMKVLSSIFASIPYYELVFDRESAWHAGFVCMMNIVGADIIPESATNKGRIDCVLRCPGDIYIIEFKFNQSAEKAIEQIREKKYYEPYMKEKKTIHLLGINFSTEEKNIIEWKDEVIKSTI